jgi:hypothetical protein
MLLAYQKKIWVMKRFTGAFYIALFSLLCLSLHSGVVAQEIHNDPEKPFIKDSTILEKPDIQVEAGFMSSFSGNGSYQYLRPSLRYPVSDRLTLSGGLLISRGSVYNTGESAALGSYEPRMHLDVAGSYKVSEQLTLSGAARFPLNNNTSNAKEGFRSLTPRQQRAFSFEANYSIADNVQIEAGFQYQEGGNAFRRRSQFFGPQRGGFNSGFGGFDRSRGVNQW